MKRPSKRDVLSDAMVVPRLPDSSCPERGDPLPRGLIGARIIRVGTVRKEAASAAEPALEGGGLLIDYIPEGAASMSRVILAFNELGMWVAFLGHRRPPGDPGQESTADTVPG